MTLNNVQIGICGDEDMKHFEKLLLLITAIAIGGGLGCNLFTDF